ncbi:hypothetical protein [Bacteroides reticulotermitis]|uniref:Mobile element protein n=1 Tax=Bacteroides reticulotermitis JCM 10512 TaxID=1445607 RepID=W4UPJ6_9BACE|nr:hypothetical protein [Bacteroides reticulotermitis]GAE82752.1 mobile element protein [Bacteroides reticulotermitis JCM 10512]
MSRQMLHAEYLADYPDGYRRSRFCACLQEYMSTSRPAAHLEHKVGDKMFIDYAGDKQGSLVKVCKYT